MGLKNGEIEWTDERIKKISREESVIDPSSGSDGPNERIPPTEAMEVCISRGHAGRKQSFILCTDSSSKIHDMIRNPQLAWECIDILRLRRGETAHHSKTKKMENGELA